MNKLVIGSAVLAALLGIGVTLYQGNTRTVPSTSAPDTSATATASVATATRTGAKFNFLQEPRPLPELRFAYADGRPMTLANFRGKVVLLNLWATWCGPCREEMPALDRLQAKLGGPEFEVVALSIDQGGVPVIQDFYQELGLKALGIYSDPAMRAPSQLNVLGIPTTLMIDREGRELGRYIGPAEWDSSEMVGMIQGYLNPDSVAARSAALPAKKN